MGHGNGVYASQFLFKGGFYSYANKQLLCWSGKTDTEHIVQYLVQTVFIC